MKAVWLAVVFPSLCLCACNRPREAPAAADAAAAAAADAAGEEGAHGRQSRYVGIGIYHPDQTWQQIAAAETPAPAQTVGANAPKTPTGTAATLKDDDEVIVVADTRTGELRQCGNLSGVCVSMNPWAKRLALTQNAPLTLTKNAEELAAEAAARSKAEMEANNRALARAMTAAKKQAEEKAKSAEPADTQ